MYVTHKETYWSGHNELDLKCDGLKAVLSAANSRNTRVFSEFEKWIFRCSFRQFFPKCFLFVKCAIKVAIWKNFADKHRWRCIEEVITRTTRNRFGVMSATWVRIPPSPPKTKLTSGFPFVSFSYVQTTMESSLLKIGCFLLKNITTRTPFLCIRRIHYIWYASFCQQIASKAPLNPFTIASAEDSLEL